MLEIRSKLKLKLARQPALGGLLPVVTAGCRAAVELPINSGEGQYLH